MRMTKDQLADVIRSGGLSVKDKSLAKELGVYGIQSENHGSPATDQDVMEERELQKNAEEYLRARDCIAFHMPGRAAIGNMPGWPDITCVAPFGRVLFYELKSANGEPSSEQSSLIRKFERRGHKVCVSRNMDTVIKHWHSAMDFYV